MEDIFNNTSLDKGDNFTFLFGYFDYNDEAGFIINVVTSIIICICLPLTFVAIYALYSQVKNDHVAPIYVINLLISDLIQLFCMIVWVVQLEDKNMYRYVLYVYHFGVTASVCFMFFIALERYLVIVHPLWYRFKRTIKLSVAVCVLVWVLPAVYFLIFFTRVKSIVTEIIAGVFLLIPLPCFLFFLCGTLKALSASVSVSSEEKWQIVGTLVLVLLIYALLFLPSIILNLTLVNVTLINLNFTFLRLSPLADLVLYVFIRKGTINTLQTSVCCCRMESSDSSSATMMHSNRLHPI